MKKKTNRVLAEASVSDVMLRQYFASILFTEKDDNDDPLDKNYDDDEFSEEAVKQAKKDLGEFVNKAGKLIEDLDETDVAHDFWLTRNGSGAGFWDRDYSDDIDPEGTLCEDLTEIAKTFSEQYAYIVNGKIYLEKG